MGYLDVISNSQIFVYFKVSFCMVIFFSFIVVREYALYEFYFFKYLEMFFITEITIFLVKVSWALENILSSAID